MTKNKNNTAPIICWFRRDLRLTDNPMWTWANTQNTPIVALYVLDEEREGDSGIGSASKWWLHHSLKSLKQDLDSQGISLIIRAGHSNEVVESIAGELNSTQVCWNRVYEPNYIKRDTQLKKSLKKQSIQAESFIGDVLIEPWEIETKSGKPYQVFTPFWKALQLQYDHQPILNPKNSKLNYKAEIKTLSIENLNLLPNIAWDTEFYKHWTPGEDGAKRRLKLFLKKASSQYNDSRNIPSVTGTSKLSPHLHFGEISPRQVWQKCLEFISKEPKSKQGTWGYIREIAWREFNIHLLYHFPKLPKQALKSQFQNFPWTNSKKDFDAWKNGLTGFPIVDAGMRELWTTGWMHNRVRMIVASFLIKDLFIDWKKGAEWFWDTLVDADLANNTGGWQWTAGCGADAAPYFRIFNPLLQSEKFDPNGEYIRKWIPELAPLDNKWIHKPSEAPPLLLSELGITLGKDYPFPIVNHSEARDQALTLYQQIKQAS